MLVITASEASRISDLSQKDYLYRVKINMISNIIMSAYRNDKFANEYLPNEITFSEIEGLKMEFEEVGYNVRILRIGNDLLFSISW